MENLVVCDVPHDVDNDLLRPWVDIATIDEMFARLSWQVFVALVWPVRSNDEACVALGDPTGVPRFDTFRDVRDLTPAHGLQPLPWSAARDERGIPLWNRELMVPAFQRLSAPTQADGRTLRDRAGAPVRYESRINRVIFEYVRDHELYNVEGQRAFSTPVYMSQGLYWDKRPEGGQRLDTDAARQGSIAIKLAWKEISARDDRRRFHTSSIAATGASGKPVLIECGLVGMHIAHKTQSCASWVWSTFEHVDALEAGDDLTGYVDTPLFRDPSSNDPPNVPSTEEGNGFRPTQVERVVPISEVAAAMNRRYRALLASLAPKWAHFRLLGTQRLAQIPKYREVVPRAARLVNPMFETYVAPPQASAIDAHRLATLADGRGVPADFMFLLKRAKPAWQQVGTIALDDSETSRCRELPWGSAPSASACRPPNELLRALRASSFGSADATLECIVPGFEWVLREGSKFRVVRTVGRTLAVFAPS